MLYEKWEPPQMSGSSAEISWPLLSKTLPLLAIPATQPWALIYGHPGTRHAEWNGKGGAEEGEAK